MHKTVRNLILAATILAGFVGTSYATSMSGAPQPYPPGVPRG
jgi:nitrate/nitrite transporter NarK